MTFRMLTVPYSLAASDAESLYLVKQGGSTLASLGTGYSFLELIVYLLNSSYLKVTECLGLEQLSSAGGTSHGRLVQLSGVIHANGISV